MFKIYQFSNERDKRMKHYFMNVVNDTAKLSYAKRNKVGAVIVKDNRIISIGFNGTPHGFDNCCEETLEDGSLKTKSNVIHAEMNSIAFAAKYDIGTNGCELYCSLSPCVNCALLIIQSGIKTVYFSEIYRDTSGLEMLEASGITTYLLKF